MLIFCHQGVQVLRGGGMSQPRPSADITKENTRNIYIDILHIQSPSCLSCSLCSGMAPSVRTKWNGPMRISFAARTSKGLGTKAHGRWEQYAVAKTFLGQLLRFSRGPGRSNKTLNCFFFRLPTSKVMVCVAFRDNARC